MGVLVARASVFFSVFLLTHTRQLVESIVVGFHARQFLGKTKVKDLNVTTNVKADTV